MKRIQRTVCILLGSVLLLTGCAGKATPAVPAENAPNAAAVAATVAPAPASTPEPTPAPKAVQTESEYWRDSRMIAYSNYIAAVGLNVQAGDEVLIEAPVCAYPLVERIAEACYQLGASAVNVSYSDAALENAAMRYIKDGKYDELVDGATLTSWLSAEDSTVSSLYILSPTFDQTPPEPAVQQAYHSAVTEAMSRVKDWKQSSFTDDPIWCIAACANRSWANKVFPDLSEDEAYAALWEDIFSFAYLDAASAEASVAKAHVRELDNRAEALTQMGIASLHFVGGGTDITVELHQPHRFQGPSSVAAAPVITLPNIPSEECFTMPRKTGVNGTVAASRPLVLSSGTVIENLKMTFVDGYLTEWSADTGTEAFAQFLETENARYLGEVALVSANSPIFETGRIYFSTLFDENATCHMALGQALYEFNLPAGAEMDDEINLCAQHLDFMFGTEDMEATATLLDGSERPILHEGVWAF